MVYEWQALTHIILSLYLWTVYGLKWWRVESAKISHYICMLQLIPLSIAICWGGSFMQRIKHNETMLRVGKKDCVDLIQGELAWNNIFFFKTQTCCYAFATEDCYWGEKLKRGSRFWKQLFRFSSGKWNEFRYRFCWLCWLTAKSCSISQALFN